MKPLNQLIDSACDVEEAANEYADIHHIQGQGLYGNIVEDFKAGAAEVAKRLGPALENACETLHLMPNDGYAIRSLERIRAILEGGGE